LVDPAFSSFIVASLSSPPESLPGESFLPFYAASFRDPRGGASAPCRDQRPIPLIHFLTTFPQGLFARGCATERTRAKGRHLAVTSSPEMPATLSFWSFVGVLSALSAESHQFVCSFDRQNQVFPPFFALPLFFNVLLCGYFPVTSSPFSATSAVADHSCVPNSQLLTPLPFPSFSWAHARMSGNLAGELGLPPVE